jgi:hypothetical protein
MIRVIALASRPLRMPSALANRATNVFVAVADFWRRQLDRLTDPYHPELHYMRGPGPKWRAKNPAADIDLPASQKF